MAASASGRREIFLFLKKLLAPNTFMAITTDSGMFSFDECPFMKHGDEQR
jgi:hypothetical protein